MDYEDFLRRERLTPIHPLGCGKFGGVFYIFRLEYGFAAAKIIEKEKYNKLEWKKGLSPFILKYYKFADNRKCNIIVMEYANLKTLNIIAKQPQIPLPSYTLRALMKQILEGMRVFHSAGLIHRDIKPDNILLHSPPGSGRVHVKISDFGFAKQEDNSKTKQTQLVGTLPFMSPELFDEYTIITQKVDMYAIGVIFYRLVTHIYPLLIMMAQLKSIDRPSEIKDDIQWDFLSRLLEFDPIKRISAAEALQHPYFTSPEAIADISKEQQDLASLAAKPESKEDNTITQFDKDPTFIVSESDVKTEEAQQVEKELQDRNMTLEDIKVNLENFQGLKMSKKDIVCINLIVRLKENKENREKAMRNGSIDELIKILSTQPLESIHLIYWDPLSVICEYGDGELRQQLIEKNAFKCVRRTLNTENEEILESSTCIIYQLMRAFLKNEDDGSPNPLYEQLNDDKTLEKLIQIFNTKYQFKQITSNVAFTIAYLHKAIPLQDKLKEPIIKHIKDQIKSDVTCIKIYSPVALALLSESNENHDQILADQFLVDLNSIIQQEWMENYYPNTFLLLHKLFKFGKDETKEQIKKLIDLNRVAQIILHENEDISRGAKEFLNVIDLQFVIECKKEQQKEDVQEREKQKDESQNEHKDLNDQDKEYKRE
ncbi:MAG: putative serine/threonine protein kinase [Streblomastix strix]|uniref:Putative serine/threonine protein kinase n=1 Tax=Streblomastix strix TaxID=222440 RepID=A0A5J4VZ33_9EUKA|nr:MAG: putative serine/threonine protein kinase [Streblomastix strix]